MKKIVFLTMMFSCFLTGIFAKPAVKENIVEPAFEKEHSTVVSREEVSDKLKDNIRLMSMTRDENISFTVYILDENKNEWFCYGTGFLTTPGDTDFISQEDKNAKLSRAKKIAIVSNNGKDYEYSFKEKHHDLYIYIK